MSAIRHSLRGRIEAISPVNECRVESASTRNETFTESSRKEKEEEASVGVETTLKQSSKKKKRAVSATRVSRVRTKQPTSSAKSESCKKRIRNTPLCVTSGPVSTSSAGDLAPFWNKYSLDLSRKLSLHTATACVASDLSWSNASSGTLTRG